MIRGMAAGQPATVGEAAGPSAGVRVGRKALRCCPLCLSWESAGRTAAAADGHRVAQTAGALPTGWNFACVAHFFARSAESSAVLAPSQPVVKRLPVASSPVVV